MRTSEIDQVRAPAVTIRRVVEADREEVERIAQRDSAPVPAAPLLGVEVDGRLLAVTSLANGDTIADPFTPTHESRTMLELRAAQLRRGAANGGGRGLRIRLPGRSRASLAGSPPGAAGRLLTLGE